VSFIKQEKITNSDDVLTISVMVQKAGAIKIITAIAISATILTYSCACNNSIAMSTNAKNKGLEA
jgi:hypothetical protein